MSIEGDNIGPALCDEVFDLVHMRCQQYPITSTHVVMVAVNMLLTIYRKTSADKRAVMARDILANLRDVFNDVDEQEGGHA